jgi:hypothetical protein
MAARRYWYIQVCRTCSRVAQWPFCEHRDMWEVSRSYVDPPLPSWYETVRVREVSGG